MGSLSLIGARILEFRKQRGLSQDDVQRATGFSHAYISNVERGQTLPSLESIERFADALQVPLSELFRSGEAGSKTRTTDPASDPSDLLALLRAHVGTMTAKQREILLALALRLAEKCPPK
jgi:transcriptional regulator with XRE-family HTH domain